MSNGWIMINSRTMLFVDVGGWRENGEWCPWWLLTDLRREEIPVTLTWHCFLRAPPGTPFWSL